MNEQRYDNLTAASLNGARMLRCKESGLSLQGPNQFQIAFTADYLFFAYFEVSYRLRIGSPSHLMAFKLPVVHLPETLPTRGQLHPSAVIGFALFSLDFLFD